MGSANQRRQAGFRNNVPALLSAPVELWTYNLHKRRINKILENFRLCLIQRTLEELPDFEVMTWQLCRMLRSALNCFQVTRFCVQK